MTKNGVTSFHARIWTRIDGKMFEVSLSFSSGVFWSVDRNDGGVGRRLTRAASSEADYVVSKLRHSLRAAADDAAACTRGLRVLSPEKTLP